MWRVTLQKERHRESDVAHEVLAQDDALTQPAQADEPKDNVRELPGFVRTGVSTGARLVNALMNQ